MILQKLEKFFQKNKISKKPVLLGYSGGIDSKALLYLLLEYKKKFFLDLHVAHVDHRWRRESSNQAMQLQKEIEGMGILFHLKTLPKIQGKDLENRYRKMRIAFFKELFKKYDYEALILAHHRDDIVETVLKRFLEGANLSHIFGIKEKSKIDCMQVWRPLAMFPKKDLKRVIEEKKLFFIDDETNRDERYLRANLRENILPYLSLKFGKQIKENLYTASLRSLELKEYLDKKTDKVFEKRVKGPFGVFLKKEDLADLEPLEIKHLIKRICNSLNLDVSRKSLDRIFTEKDFSINGRGYSIISEKNILFFLKNKIFFKGVFMDIKEGVFKIGKWMVEISSGEFFEEKSSWQDVFKGKSSFFLPKGKYHLSFAKSGDYILGKRLNRWFSENKVPRFMRFAFPVIFQGNEVFYEFLSGRKRFRSSKEGYRIFLKGF